METFASRVRKEETLNSKVLKPKIKKYQSAVQLKNANLQPI